MTDNHTPEVRSYNMSRIRSKDTKPEELVRKYLFKHGLRYRKNDKRYPGKPDIVLPKYKTIIFIHGCFWHQHLNCKAATIPETNYDYWKKKLEANISRDEKVKTELEEAGWKVIVVWECEISNKKRQEIRLPILINEIIQ